MNAAVIGVGFGDEGKGMFVDYLCSQYPKSLVVRFNGGHQAGHTVVHGDKRHVFSNFGSGSFRNVPTFWSRFCTVDPIGFLRERKLLVSKGVKPIIYMDGACEITTPFDKEHNINNVLYKKNGTCGVGFGPTIERSEKGYHLRVIDLYYNHIFHERYNRIADYYGKVYRDNEFVLACDELKKCIQPVNESILHLDKEAVIFEGAQGLLLDQEKGFFPNVTRSNTGFDNLFRLTGANFWLYLVTRAYQTRHGNGFMTNTHIDFPILSDPFETNVKNVQGEFRRTMLDVSLIEYAFSVHGVDQAKLTGKKALVITCLDHLTEYKFTYRNEVVLCNNKQEFIAKIAALLKFEYVFASGSTDPNSIELISFGQA